MIIHTTYYPLTSIFVEKLVDLPAVHCSAFRFPVVPFWTLKIVVYSNIQFPIMKCQTVDGCLFASIGKGDKLPCFVFVRRFQFMLKWTWNSWFNITKNHKEKSLKLQYLKQINSFIPSFIVFVVISGQELCACAIRGSSCSHLINFQKRSCTRW